MATVSNPSIQATSRPEAVRPARAGRGRPLDFGRRLALSLVLVAIAPLVAFGLFVSGRVDVALASAAEARVSDALAAVDAVLARRDEALEQAVGAYGSWSVTGDLIAERRFDDLRDDVLAFIERRGEVDVAIAVVDGALISSGGSAGRELLAALAPDGSIPELVMTEEGSIQVASAPISGSSSTASDARLIFGDRLDSDFVTEVRRLTGFDSAGLGPDGSSLVASDAAAAAAIQPHVGAVDGPSGRLGDGALPAGWIRPADGSGGTIVVTLQPDELRTVLVQLPGVLLATLAVAAFLAVVVSLLVSRDLNLRLASIHSGLLDVAAGRRPAGSTSGGPEVQRLGAALDDLVEAMDRRERILREASLTVASWHPDHGETTLGSAAVEGAVRIFGTRASAIVAAGGSRLAASGPTPGPTDRLLEAPLEGGTGEGGWLQAWIAADAPWTDADDALFGMYALLVGGALSDARVHDQTGEQLERLGRLNDLQREFLRSVSHNLQTPLTTISLAADDLADPGSRASAEVRARQAHAIQVQAHRLERLVAQLLTVSRLDAGRMHLERDAVAVGPLARRVWEELDADRPLTVSLDAGDLVAVGDREAIEQILWILLDNALRYAPTGPIAVVTTTDPTSDGPRVRIAVEDAGPGVAERDRRHIFRRFWSGAAGRAQGGTGIGLDIARRLARAMDGTLQYDAERAVGARFVLTLPADVARAD